MRLEAVNAVVGNIKIYPKKSGPYCVEQINELLRPHRLRVDFVPNAIFFIYQVDEAMYGIADGMRHFFFFFALKFNMRLLCEDNKGLHGAAGRHGRVFSPNFKRGFFFLNFQVSFFFLLLIQSWF